MLTYENINNLITTDLPHTMEGFLWKQINIMNELTQLTEELWVENSNGRLNALRLKKSLKESLSEIKKQKHSNLIKESKIVKVL